MKLHELFEMAIPRESDRAKIYYHGTDTEEKAKSIMAHGLDPAKTLIKYEKNPKSNFAPQEGSVYITPHLDYAMIYAIGGNMAGHDCTRDIPRYGQFAFVFEISGRDLVDITPDEDSIGEFLCRYWSTSDYYKNKYPEFFEKDAKLNVMRRVANLALQKLTEPQRRRIKDGESEYWAKGGKRSLPYLSDDLKFGLIELGAHIAHKGPIKVTKCFKFDRADVIKMKKDGSNFFDYTKECEF